MTVDLSKYPYRIQRLMGHTCDLYRPATMGAAPGGSVEGSDFKYNHTKAYSGVPWYYQATPESDGPKLQGVSKQVNIFTMDKGHFVAETEIGDRWLVVMTTPGHPYFGRVWITLGNSTMNAGMPGRPTDSQWIYMKLADTISIPSGG